MKEETAGDEGTVGEYALDPGFGFVTPLTRLLGMSEPLVGHGQYQPVGDICFPRRIHIQGFVKRLDGLVVLANPTDEFAETLALARQGDPVAIARLVERYEPKVRMVAHVLLGRALRPYLDSVDLVQSVHKSLIVALRTRDYDLSSPEQLVALAITMVRRKTARHWRRVQRQQRLTGGADESGNLPQLLASLSDCREEPADAAQFNDQLEHLCENLDASERRMLEMRLQGYTSPEVARELGMHAVAVRVRWTRLRQRLQASGVVADWI
jgi:RNA polymerase sigma-70 factor (ECF subfamily)